MTGVSRALLDWVNGGSALTALVEVFLAVCTFVFGLILRRYLGILGADRRRPAERQAYDALRNGLAHGNKAARLYAERLTRFLDWIDDFFGDAGMADRTLFPHAFGLRTPAPLWTAPSLDCCLFLALLYPVATISVIWAISGQVGPAETALRLQPDLFAWQRVSVTAVTGLFIYDNWHAGTRTNIRKTIGRLAAFLAGFAILVAWGSPFFAVYYTTLTLCFTYISLTNRNLKGVLSIIAVFIALGQSGGAGYGYLIVAMTGCGALYYTGKAAVKFGLEGIFYPIFFPLIISALLLAARLLSASAAWEYTGPALLFLGLLTLLIAPFDWASLGLTRALLRRGLELGGWWPYALALADAAVAGVIIVALALTVLVGVQAFDELAVYGGGTPIFAVDKLFKGLAANPSGAAYWWLYALLLTTMIPSLVNLGIGGASLVRGVPGVPSLLLRFIPERGHVLKWDRHWIATVLTAQIAAGTALGILAQVFLVWAIIGHVMPFFGLELLGVARDVAAFNLPARVGHLFGVSL